MASEQGYTRQVADRPITPKPSPSPQAFGAGLGDQLEHAGEELHREQLQTYQVQRRAAADAERSDRFQQLAQFKTQFDKQREQLRQNAAPGAAGHLDAVGNLLSTDATAPLLDGVKEDSTRQWLQQQIAAFRSDAIGTEDTFVAAKQVEKTLNDATTGLDQLANNAVTSSDPQAWPAAHRDWQSYVGGLNLDGNDKEKLARDGMRTIDMAKSRQLIDQDPHQFLALLDHGVLNDSLKPEELSALRERAQVEIHSLEVKAHTQAALVKSAVSDQVDTTLKTIRDGGEVDPDALGALRAKAVAAGLDTSKLYDIDSGIARSRINSEFRDAGPDVIGAAIAHIDQKLAGQKTDDPALVQRRKALAELLPARRQQIAGDMVGWAAQNGMPTAPFTDTAPPADQVQARVHAVDAAAASAGLPPKYLNDDEQRRFSAVAAQGKAGALEALDFARRFGAAKGIEVARQIKPNDESFAWLVALPPESRGLALTGQEALKGNPKLVSYSKTDNPELADASDVQDKQFAQATVGMDQRQVTAVRSTFRNVLAGFVAEGHPLDAGLRWRAYNQALGASGSPGTTQRGGIAKWTADGPAFAVPSTMTAGEFKRRVQASWAHDGPVNPDKSPANLSQAWPRRMGPTQYYFVSKSGQPFRRADGAIYHVDVGQ
jgi:hypothetical protein